jgi:hypothetical protein
MCKALFGALPGLDHPHVEVVSTFDKISSFLKSDSSSQSK